jgi:hypothetical protein
VEQTPPGTPSTADLKRITAFIRARSHDEARTTGSMHYFADNGVTLKAGFPPGFHQDGKSQVAAWLDEHTPDRFMDMTHALANLADELTRTHRAVRDALADHQACIMWGSLVQAARLWEGHPDFDPAWSKEDAS